MAGLPHYRNSRAAMNKFEPVYLSQFEIQLTPPPAVAAWTLVMENVLKVTGVDINKLPGVVEQKYKSAKRSFAGGMNDATVADVQIEFEVNVVTQFPICPPGEFTEELNPLPAELLIYNPPPLCIKP